MNSRPDDMTESDFMIEELADCVRPARGHAPNLPRLYRADVPIQDRLFLDHIRLVYGVARRLLQTHGEQTSLSDLLRMGMVGLQQAVEAYDSAGAVSFPQHATPYIRRAILYELSAATDLSPDARAVARHIHEAEEELALCLGRRPDESEVAWCLDVDVVTLGKMRAEVERKRIASYRNASDHVDQVVHAFSDAVQANEEHVPPEAVLRDASDVAAIKNAFLSLREQDRLVLSLVYYEKLSIADVAMVLQMSAPMVVEIHGRALRLLRRAKRRMHLVGAPHQPVA